MSTKSTAHHIPHKEAKNQQNRWYTVVIDNQLSHRNLDPFEVSVLRGKKYLLEKKEVERPKKLGQNDQDSKETRERLGQETGVSPKTIQRDAQLAEAVEKLEETPREVLKQNPKKDIIESHSRRGSSEASKTKKNGQILKFLNRPILFYAPSQKLQF